MDFFQHQDTAKRNTRWLVILFLLAVASLILMTTAVVAVVVFYFQNNAGPITGDYSSVNPNVIANTFSSISWEILGYITLGVGAVVALGSSYKLLQLGSGGKAVAESMGGRLLNINTRDADERKILNVVEEIAIASGTPVPPVYLMEDESINAFAAGFKPQDAVIGITRGCIRLLNRDELQGVIAHEFSHILHGDMRLNIRLVGILHGILVIGLIGYMITRSAGYGRFSSSRKGNNVAAMFFVGISLIVIGYAGTFFGNIIKAAVSRQREFLADASAVQFTRNPQGISGALKKIGGYSYGSLLQSPHAAEFSHMYFGQGVVTHLRSLMATHPPLQERIKRIQPNWNGKFPVVDQQHAASSQQQTSSAQTSQFAGSDPLEINEVVTPSPHAEKTQSALAAEALATIGTVSTRHVDFAKQAISDIPEKLNDAAHDPFSARALVYALLLDHSHEKVIAKQWQRLRQAAHPVVFKLTEKYAADVASMSRRFYLPLLELCIPALKALSPTQFDVFKKNLVELIRADNEVDIFEWALYRILNHNLEPEPNPNTSKSLNYLKEECRILLSMVAQAGHEDNPQMAKTAFNKASEVLGLGKRTMMDRELIKLPELDRVMDELMQLKPLQKPLLLKALAASIETDQKVTVIEAELFRAVADSLDCPVPPLLAYVEEK